MPLRIAFLEDITPNQKQIIENCLSETELEVHEQQNYGWTDSAHILLGEYDAGTEDYDGIDDVEENEKIVISILKKNNISYEIGEY